MSREDHLHALFEADRALRQAEAMLLADSDRAALTDLLAGAVREAASLGDRDEATMRLERLADLCAQVPGPEMADALISILNDVEPSVRVAAGEALLDVGYERYAEVARAMERALDRGLAGPAMAELPWLLAEIGEPSALGLIRRFLAHSDPDVVAASIEALAQLGDPTAVSDLERLADDERIATLEDMDDETGSATIGQLAREAMAELTGDEER